jgi:uncharacterized protein (DUF3084 family)
METRFVRRGTVVTLAAVLGLLVAATGVLVVLYVLEQGDAGRVAGEVTRTERTIDDRRDRLGAIESTVDDLESERSRLTGENQRLRACADPAKDSIAAARAGDKAAFDKALDEVLRNCER